MARFCVPKKRLLHRVVLCVAAFVTVCVIIIPLHLIYGEDEEVLHLNEGAVSKPRKTFTSTLPPTSTQRPSRATDAAAPKRTFMWFNETNEEMLAHLNSLDPLPPRDGEKPITFMEFIQCIEQRLQVDRTTQTELPIPDDKPFIPYLVLPVTFELRDMKQFVCNITVPFKHLMYVQNGPIYSMSEFLDITAEIFSFTSRLQIRHYPKNIGYAGALNVGMRHAMTFPFEEVPFFFMSNNDVRFHESTLLNGLPKLLEASMGGAALLQEFAAEVAAEPNEYTPAAFREVPLRSWDGEHVLVTSRYLPDRIRYMSFADRAKIFRGHAGVLYPDRNSQTAVWGLSRLAMETVGFFDENCFPAYHEDTEYLERTQLFGFDVIHGARTADGTIHLTNNFLVTTKAYATAKELGDVLVFLRGLTEIIRFMLPSEYVQAKRSMVDLGKRHPQTNVRRPLLPPDAYVLNERRRRALDEMIELSLEHFRDTSVIPPLTPPPNIIAFVNSQKRHQLFMEKSPSMDAVAYYRNGYALRRLSLSMK